MGNREINTLPKISIVTISFNQVQFLETAIRSVVEQGYPNLEYIVVDPGSTDGSRDVIERYRDKIDKIIFEPDNGPADGLNKGFVHATGEIFGFINSDDALLPGALERVAKGFLEHLNVDVISGHLYLVDGNGKLVSRRRASQFDQVRFVYGGVQVAQQSTFFRERAFKEVGGFNPQNVADWDAELLLEMGRAGKKFMVIDDYLAIFRIHEGSITGSARLRSEYQINQARYFEMVTGRRPKAKDKVLRGWYRLYKWGRDPKGLVVRLYDALVMPFVLRSSQRRSDVLVELAITKPFVVYWNNIPSPYMVERFNALADRGMFNFEAWFNDRIGLGYSWDVVETDWRFRYRYLPATRIAGRTLHWPLPLFGRRPNVLVSLYAEPVFLSGWALAKLRGLKTGFWVEVTFDSWVTRSPIKEWLKRWLFPRVDAVITVGADGKQFAERYGVPARRIFFAPHTIDVAHYANGASDALPQRDALREELCLRGTTFIYVGRLWWGKGVNYLLEAFARVQQLSTEEVSLLLVGDGAEETKLRQQCAERGIRNVVFAGFKQKPELPCYYALADVFVFPTLGDPYGLVVDEAMACSLPLVSTIAAGEIHERIEEGVNGYTVPPEDSAALAERMLHLAQDPALRARMGQASAEKIRGHTPERWAQDFERVVFALLNGRES